VDEPTHSVAVVTDEAGRFELKGLDPGHYRLTASRLGYVVSEYGQRKANDPGAVLTLRAGQEMKDLLFRLVPAAIIAGRILDDDSEPLPGVTVSALREVYSEGKRSLATATTAETNDLGEYRLYGLAPGRYFVSAVFPQWSRFGDANGSEDTAASSQGYAKIYFPGTPEAAKAISFSVKAGEEIPSVEMLMQQVVVYRIRGHVYNQITHKPGTNTTVVLTARNQNHEWDSGYKQADVQKQDGSFEIPEITPGSYVLTAMWFDEGQIYSTTLPIEVGKADVEGIAVTIGQGVNISGQIVWEGKPRLERDELTVTAVPVGLNFVFQGGARVSQGDSFVLRNVGDGTYHAELAGESKDCYIKDVRYAGSSVIDDGFTVVRGAAASLEISISPNGASVKGAVSDANGLPVAGVWVVLVPSAPRRGRHRLYKKQTTDQYGHFELRGIEPGDYMLFSWDEVEDGAWEDADFLKPFEEKGQKVAVQEGDSKGINLTTIVISNIDQKKQ
jgi:protocatechuate 3,4-dioxygenase beta subunit